MHRVHTPENTTLIQKIDYSNGYVNQELTPGELRQSTDFKKMFFCYDSGFIEISIFQFNNLSIGTERIYQSDEILKAEDLYIIQDMVSSSGMSIKYQMTSGEIGWYKYIQSKYCIADYIKDNTDGNFILTINGYEISKAMDDDNRGAGKATMLSDETALQKIFFWCYSETEENNNE